MVKKKKAVSPAEAGLRKLLKGDFQGWWNISAEMRRHLVAFAGSLVEAKENKVPSAERAIEYLRFLVNLLVSKKSAGTPGFAKPLAGLKRAINNEIKRLP